VFAIDMARLTISPAGSDGQAQLLRLAGELDLISERPLLESLQPFEGQHVVLDLSDVSFTDSTGLAALIGARRRAHSAGATLRVRGARGQTRELLARTGMLAVLAGEA
jgi:anti-sigma B factor antagonist